MMRSFFLIALAAVLAGCTQHSAAPEVEVFGLTPGMSKKQIERLVALDPVQGGYNLYRAHSVPNPRREFDYYSLFIDPNLGLVGVVAIATEPELDGRQTFSSVRDALQSRYGDPTQAIGDPWDTYVAASWEEGLPGGLVRIELEHYLWRNLLLGYHFDGFEEARQRVIQRKDDAL